MDKSKCKSAHCLEVCRNLWSLQQSGQLCDIFLTTGEDVVFAHRIVLAAICPFFLQPGLSDSSNTDGGLTVQVNDYSGDLVKEVVRFAYTGFMVVNQDNIDGISNLCTKWQVQSGLKLCEKFKSQIKKETKRRGSRQRDSEQRDSEQRGSDERDCEERKLVQSESQQKESEQRESEDGDLEQTTNISRFRARKRVSYTEEYDGETQSESETYEAEENSGPQTKKIKTEDYDDEWIPQGTDGGSPELTDEDVKVKLENEESNQEDLPDEDSQHTEEYMSKPIVIEPKPTSKRKKYRPIRRKGPVSILPKSVQIVLKRIPGGDSSKKKSNTPGEIDRKSIITSSNTATRCVRCREMFPTHTAIAEHKKVCATCHRCKKTFESPDACVSHMQERSCKKPEEKYNCDKCSKSFVQKDTYESHMKSSHWTEEMGELDLKKCTYEGCKFTTVLQRNLAKHMRFTHAETKPVMCDVCGVMSRNVYYLKIHKRTRHAPPQSCELCGLVVKTRQVLKSHMARQHGQGAPEHLCSICTYMTFTKPELDSHMFHRHNVPLPEGKVWHTCPHCNWKTVQKHGMEQHILRHTAKERNFPCAICNKRFITQSDLRGHMVIHDPDRKMFKCPHCDFSTAYGHLRLRDHVNRMHEKKDYKPWACDICSYRTNVKGNLTSHLRKTHKLSVETQQHVINSLEPFRVAHADMKLTRTTGPKDGAKKKQQKKSQDNITQQSQEVVAVAATSVTTSVTTMSSVPAPQQEQLESNPLVAPQRPPAMGDLQSMPLGVVPTPPMSLGNPYGYPPPGGMAVGPSLLSSGPGGHPSGVVPPAHMNPSRNPQQLHVNPYGGMGGGMHQSDGHHSQRPPPTMQQALPLNMATMQSNRVPGPCHDGGQGTHSSYMESVINSLVSRNDQM